MGCNMMLFLKFLRNQSGATAIEYAIIAGIISIAVVGGATLVGTGISDTLDDAAAPL